MIFAFCCSAPGKYNASIFVYIYRHDSVDIFGIRFSLVSLMLSFIRFLQTNFSWFFFLFPFLMLLKCKHLDLFFFLLYIFLAAFQMFLVTFTFTFTCFSVLYFWVLSSWCGYLASKWVDGQLFMSGVRILVGATVEMGYGHNALIQLLVVVLLLFLIRGGRLVLLLHVVADCTTFIYANIYINI